LCVYLKVGKENNVKANTTFLIGMALLVGLTLFQITVVNHQAAAAPARNNQPLWEYQDLKCLDPWGDSDSNDRDAVAVYSKSDTNFFYFRVDLLDLTNESNIDLYCAIDCRDGGNTSLINGNSVLSSDIQWDVLMALNNKTGHKVLDSSYVDHPEYFNDSDYQSELDFIEFSIKKNALADWDGKPFTVQMIVTTHDTTSISDKTSPVSTDASTGRSKLVMVFGNMFIGYGPHAISWYDGFSMDSANRKGERRGLRYLLDAVEKYGIPLTTTDVRLEILPGLEYLGINDRLRDMSGKDLLDILDTLSYAFFMPWQPEDVDTRAINRAKNARTALSIPLSDVFYPYEAMLTAGDLNAIKKAGYKAIFGIDRYRYWLDGWITDWSNPDAVKARIESAKKIHTVNGVKVFFDTRLGNYMGFAWDNRWGTLSYPSEYDMYNGTDGGLHLWWRRILLDMALDQDQEKFFTIGGDLNLTPMVFKDVAERLIGWVANHPWIEVVTFSELLERGWNPVDHGDLGLTPDQPLERYPMPNDNHYNAYFWQFYDGGFSDGHSPLIPAGEEIEGYFDYIPYLRDGARIPSGRIMGDDNTVQSIVSETLQNLRNAPANNLTDLAWLGYFVCIEDQTFHSNAYGNWGGQYLSSDAKIRANYLGHVNKVIAASHWANDIGKGVQDNNTQALSRDLDLDGENEYILKNDKVFAIFENDGGRMEFGFAYDPSIGPLQLIAPLPQHFGLSTIVCQSTIICDYENGETALRGDWRDAAFVEKAYRYSPFEADAMLSNDNGLTFKSKDGMVEKRFTLEGNTISARYSTTDSVEIGFGLPVNMANMYSKNWAEKIETIDLDDRKGYRITDGGYALIDLLNTDLVSRDSFTDSPAKEDMQEREDYSSYPNGHWLFFPYNTLTLRDTGNFALGLTLSAGLYTGPVTPEPTNTKSDGDVAPLGSRDGTINVGDALVGLRFALGLEIPTQDDIHHGDVAPLDAKGQPNPDGVITVGDALVILRKALGIITF